MQTLHVGKLFCRSFNLAITGLARTQANKELSDVQLLALRFIQLHPKSSLQQLAKGLMISSPAATKLVHRLTERGWVNRRSHPSDQRKWVLELTDDGEQTNYNVQKLEEELFEKAVSQLTEVEKQQLFLGLEAFVQVVSREHSLEELCLQCGTDHQVHCSVAKESEDDVLPTVK